LINSSAYVKPVFVSWSAFISVDTDFDGHWFSLFLSLKWGVKLITQSL